MSRLGFISVCLFLQGVSCLAQEYPFAHYTPRDGLVNSRVRKSYQDSRGRMYFMTFAGLSMYDGARFRNYTVDTGLPNNLVNDILEIGDDSLLLATNTCGLTVLVHGKLQKLKTTGPHCPVINNFLRSEDGNIYATADDGLYKLKHAAYEKLNTKISGEPVIFLGAIAEYKDFIIFSTNDLRDYTGLFLFNKKNNNISDALPGLHVSGLTTDRSGILWISTPEKIVNLDTASLLAGQLKLTAPAFPATKDSVINPGLVVFNLLNEPLVFSATHGLTRYLLDGSRQKITVAETFGANVQHIYIDRENILWISHGGNGVYKLSDAKLQTPTYFAGMNRSGIKRVQSNSPDTSWILMNDGQMLLRSATGNKIFRIAPHVNANAMHYDAENIYLADFYNLYCARIPTSQGPVIQFRQILKFQDHILSPGRFVNDPYKHVLFCREGNIFVLKNKQVLFTYPFNPNDLVEGMFIDKLGRLCIVSRLDGLQIFSIHPGNPYTYLQKQLQFTKEFANLSPRCVTVAKAGMLWVGTRENGLLGFELGKNSLTKRFHFQTKDGLTDNFITSLAVDREDNVVIGTQTGIDRLLKSTDGTWRVENVTRSNNIFSHITFVWTDATSTAFAVNNVGELLQVEPPLNKITSGYEPQLLIEEIKVNGKPLLFRSPLQLTYDQRNISFSVAAPAFIDEKQVTYSYQLTGNSFKEWSDTSSTADITLLNLPPGEYSLRVKAFFRSTVYAPSETKIVFEILPPFWQTWWFRVGMAVLAAGIIIAGFRFYYRRRLERQSVLLERQQAVEKERSRIATDMHDDLGAGLSTIRFLSEKVKQNSFSEVTKKDADKIVFNSNDLVQKMNEIIWAMNEKNDTLEDLVFYSRSYVVEYCEENNLLYEITLPDIVPTLFVRGELRRNVFLTIKEALHNIVRHAAASKVSIAFVVDKNLFITIQDDGKGMAGSPPSPGNGLRNMQKRIDSVSGTFGVSDSNGILIKISVPLPL